MEPHPPFAAVKFGHSENTYDYIAPFPVKVGDKVWAETRRGKQKVTVVEIKEESELASAKLLEFVEETQEDMDI